VPAALGGFFVNGVYEQSMARILARDLIRQGVSTSRALMSHQDKIWSRYSRDKVDIGETLARVLRTLSKALPLDLPLRALSVGSSTEPQFRILEASFRGGLYLLDIGQPRWKSRRRLDPPPGRDPLFAAGATPRSSPTATGLAAFREAPAAGALQPHRLEHSLYYAAEPVAAALDNGSRCSWRRRARYAA
jgi:hypothetical protein